MKRTSSSSSLSLSLSSSALVRVLGALPLLVAGCVDWALLTPGEGEGEGDVGEGEGEGDVGEGEGDAGEGEGEGDAGEGEGEGVGEGEGEGEGGVDPRAWRELSAENEPWLSLSSSNGRFFLTSSNVVAELEGDTFQPVFVGPCGGNLLNGPVHATAEGELVVALSPGFGVGRIDASQICNVLGENTNGIGNGAISGFPVQNAVSDVDTILWDGFDLTRVRPDGTPVGDTVTLNDSAVRVFGRFFQNAVGQQAQFILGAPDGRVRPRAHQTYLLNLNNDNVSAQLVGDPLVPVDIFFGGVERTSIDVVTGVDVGRRRACLVWNGVADRCVDVVGNPVNDTFDAAGDDFFDVIAQPGPDTIVAFGPSALLLRAERGGDLVVNGPPRTGGRLFRFVNGTAGEVWGLGDETVSFWTPASWNSNLNPDVNVAFDYGGDPGGAALPVAGLFATRNSQGNLRIIDARNAPPLVLNVNVALNTFGPIGVVDLGGGASLVYDLDVRDTPTVTVQKLVNNTVQSGASQDFAVDDVTCAPVGDRCVLAHDMRGAQLAAAVFTGVDEARVVRCDVVVTGAVASGLDCAADPFVIDLSGVGIDANTPAHLALAPNGDVLLNLPARLVIARPAQAPVVLVDGAAPFNATGDGQPFVAPSGCIVLPAHDHIAFVAAASGASALADAFVIDSFFAGAASVTNNGANDRVVIGGGGNGNMSAQQLASLPLPGAGCLLNELPPARADLEPFDFPRSQVDLIGAAITQGRLVVLDGDARVWDVPNTP